MRRSRRLARSCYLVQVSCTSCTVAGLHKLELLTGPRRPHTTCVCGGVRHACVFKQMCERTYAHTVSHVCEHICAQTSMAAAERRRQWRALKFGVDACSVGPRQCGHCGSFRLHTDCDAEDCPNWARSGGDRRTSRGGGEMRRRRWRRKLMSRALRSGGVRSERARKG